MAINGYEIISCDQAGANRHSHGLADQLQPAHSELNTPGTFGFVLPENDSSWQYLQPMSGREVQVLRAGKPVWWGLVTNRRPNSRKWEITCQSLLHYFQKRVIGKAGRNNWLNNSGFAQGLLNWTPMGVTANVVTQWGTHEGSFQVNLYQAGSGQDTFLMQQVVVQPGYYTLAAWFQIRADSTWVGPALDGRGLYVEKLAANGTDIEDVQFFAITDATTRGVFQRATTNMDVDRPNTILRIRLYATRCTNATPSGGRPPGSIIWARTQLVLQDSQSFVYPADLADVFNNLTVHAQDSGFGKSDFRIQGANAPTGLLVDRTYFHSDHLLIYEAFKQWSDAALCDFDVTWNDAGTQRYLTIWTPQRGITQTQHQLEIDGNLTDVNPIEEDGEQVITTAIVTGQGTGADTDEGGFADTSLTNGNVFEAVLTQDAGGYYDQLDLQAKAVVETRKVAVQVPTAVAHATVLDWISLGDMIMMVSQYSNLQKPVRITAMDLDLQKDQVTLTVNG